MASGRVFLKINGVQHYLWCSRSESFAKNTIRLAFSALRAVLNAAIEDKLIAHNPAQGRFVKSEKAEREATSLKPGEIPRLLRALPRSDFLSHQQSARLHETPTRRESWRSFTCAMGFPALSGCFTIRRRSPPSGELGGTRQPNVHASAETLRTLPQKRSRGPFSAKQGSDVGQGEKGRLRK